MFFSGLVLNIIMHFRACNFRSLAKMWPSKITHFSNGLSKSLYPRNNYTAIMIRTVHTLVATCVLTVNSYGDHLLSK